ncbi:carbohydrate ABC transporter permease [Paenibacillus sp. HB172176]|uniref:carbohydrate ABC transporter permease n=1 Tax=Paenibacillus sp. HB172176 TaxID=2493690 RepID=UPI00143B1A84|nr:carbohydrate ABC transporter permease [Paenibacillus sp. HB172176]
MKESGLERLFNLIHYILLGIIALICLFPLYYVFVVSFTEPAEYAKKSFVLFPRHWSFDAYHYLLGNPAFMRAMGTSTFLAVAGTICSLLVTSTVAYGLSRRRLLGRRALMVAILITTLFNPGIIPPYLVVRELGMINSLWSLIIPVLTSGWYVLLMKGFYDSIPEDLVEAAAIDGSHDLLTWFKIILPLSLPALAAFGLFYGVAYWNTYFTAILYLTDFEKWPLQVLLRNMLIDLTNTGLEDMDPTRTRPTETLKMAAVVVATVPILLVYPFLQKHFAKGAMVGSIKG